jgi:hypothetical protein
MSLQGTAFGGKFNLRRIIAVARGESNVGTCFLVASCEEDVREIENVTVLLIV